MTAARAGFWGGLLLFAALLLMPAPAAMPVEAWRVVALAALMASWWMTQALPLTATALLPFLALPLLAWWLDRRRTRSKEAKSHLPASATLGATAHADRRQGSI